MLQTSEGVTRFHFTWICLVFVHVSHLFCCLLYYCYLHMYVVYQCIL